MLREITTIDEKCHQCGSPMKFYPKIKRTWCQRCSEKGKEEERERGREERKETLTHYRMEEMRRMLGDNIVEFDLKNYHFHPKARVSGTARKLFSIPQDLWEKNIKLFFTGAGGTGKTFTAALACREAVRNGMLAKFISVADFGAMYRPEGGNVEKTILEMKVADVLVMDDIEYRKYNENLFNDIKRILDHRFERKTGLTILTTNQPFDLRIFQNFQERRLEQFEKGIIDFGKIRFPYILKTDISETGKRIFEYLKSNEGIPVTYLDIAKNVGVSAPQQYRDQLLSVGVVMTKVVRRDQELKAFMYGL